MKIKTQISYLIFIIILLPLVVVLGLPLFQYYTSPKRTLMKGYNQVRKLQKDDLNDKTWSEIKRQLDSAPISMETAIYTRDTIIVSTIKELEAGSVLSPQDFFKFISETSDQYDYQIQSPYIKSQEEETIPMILFILRSPINHEERGHVARIFRIAMPVVVIFELVAILIAIFVSKNISQSITFLEKTTQRIASGELSEPIENPQGIRKLNEITSLTNNLESMRQSLKDDQDRRTRFIMGISHDLRTPVAIIKGYTEAIADGVVNNVDSIQNSIVIIMDKIDILESRINELIDYVKLNNSEWKQSLVYTDITEITSTFAQSATALGEISKREIISSIELPRNIQVKMDQKLYLRMLENILSNAVRYTRDNDCIYINAKMEDSNVLVSIRDTGIGISQKDLQLVWELFYRGSNSRREKGMGIGLSIVKTIVDSHGWHINVTSQEGFGTEFTVTIPTEVLA